MDRAAGMACTLTLAAIFATGCGDKPKLVKVPAGISVAPSKLSFGEIFVGEHFVRRVEFENTGMAVAMSLEAVEVPGAFEVAPAAFSIAPGGKQAVVVTFRPDAAGQVVGTILFRAREADLGAEVAVEGTGVVRQVRVAEGIDFGAVRVGESRTLPLIFSSESAAPLEVLVYSPLDRDFSLTPGSIRLEAGGQTSIAVTFSPQLRGPAETAFEFGLCANCEKFRVTLTGQGVQAILTATPDPVGFEAVALGLTRREAVTIANTGDVDLELSSVRVVGEAFALNTGNMFDFLPVGAETTLDVSFTPLVEGVHQGTLEVEGRTEGAEAHMLLSVRIFGKTGGPFLVVLPSQLDFGSLYVGLAPLRQTVALANVGDPAPLTLLSAAIEDDVAGAFRVEYEPMAFIEPSATVTVEFDPAQGGAHSGRLLLRTDGQDQAEFSVLLTGSAKLPSPCDLLVEVRDVTGNPNWVFFKNEDWQQPPFTPLSIHCTSDNDYQSPCGPCVFSNPRIGGPDARYFRLADTVYEINYDGDPAVLPYLLFYDGSLNASAFGLRAHIYMTPDTPAGRLLHAEFICDINGFTRDLPLVANRENIPPR